LSLGLLTLPPIEFVLLKSFLFLAGTFLSLSLSLQGRLLIFVLLE
jgi:hypothetical protein